MQTVGARITPPAASIRAAGRLTGSTDNFANGLARVVPAQRCPQPKAAMRPRQVVVLNALAQDLPEVALARDQQPVQVWGAESRIADDRAACREYSASPTPLDVQNSCLSQTVSPVKKPQAKTAPASALRNHCQVSPSRRGAGGTGGGAERLGSKSPTDRRLASERQGTRKRSRRKRRRL